MIPRAVVRRKNSFDKKIKFYARFYVRLEIQNFKLSVSYIYDFISLVSFLVTHDWRSSYRKGEIKRLI